MADKTHMQRAGRVISVTTSVIAIALIVAAIMWGATILKDAIANKQKANKSSAQQQNQAPADAVAAIKSTSINSPSYPGGYVSLIAIVTPYSLCNIAVHYQPGLAGPTLDQKTSNDIGQVSWSWIVSKDTQVGSWPVYLTCEVNNTKASSSVNLEVNNQ
ncbi:hypothetical protein HYX70_03735 [Candidatus Saccharibacteria bacterium]|nr:hypothetical protein [Candidatus Saccharibacteria bacterium]